MENIERFRQILNLYFDDQMSLEVFKREAHKLGKQDTEIVRDIVMRSFAEKQIDDASVEQYQKEYHLADDALGYEKAHEIAIQVLMGKISPAILTKEPSHPGFPNFGVTCFINASLKALFANHALMHLIKQLAESEKKRQQRQEERQKSEREEKKEQHKMLMCLLELYDEYQKSDDANQTRIKKHLRTIYNHPLLEKKNMHRGQQDASEFLRFLLDTIGMNTFSKNQIEREQETSPLVGEGSTNSQKTQNAWILELDTFKSSMQEMIEQLYHPTVPEDSNRVCLTSMRKIPDGMVLQVPRFDENGNKRTAPIFDILNPVTMTTSEHERFKEEKLIPTSIICHMGPKDCKSGHYRALENIGNTWILHDDMTTQKIEEDAAREIAMSQAYLVFYSKVES